MRDMSVSLNDVTKAVAKIQLTNAAGPDGIIPEHIKLDGLVLLFR